MFCIYIGIILDTGNQDRELNRETKNKNQEQRIKKDKNGETKKKKNFTRFPKKFPRYKKDFPGKKVKKLKISFPDFRALFTWFPKQLPDFRAVSEHSLPGFRKGCQ